MTNSLIFNAWQRSQLFLHAAETGPRLEGHLDLTLTDTNSGPPATGSAPFILMGAGEIAGLRPGAIKHMAPAPFARDAETTKFVHVDLWEPDLPWRYTPRKNELNTLRPWLVLLVGTAEEIQVAGGIANVTDSVLLAHNLASSFLWAHTQDDGSKNEDGSKKIISRILSPCKLTAQRAYLAVLVPAFNENGDEMWTPSGDGIQRTFGKKGFLPALHSWVFWTADAGDFETLATALKIPPAGNVGKAKLHYRRVIPADGVNIEVALEVRGAITSLQQEETPQPDKTKQVHDDIHLLSQEIPDAIGLPQYGRPWLPNPADFSDGWPALLREDPRFRGTAGLGLWMGIEAQEDLMDAAVKQAGALREAGQRIGQLALGLLASGRLWDRRMPKDKNERLRILGPLMGRMLAANGGLVLERVTSGTSPLVPALFSSAAQRILRDRSTQTRHIQGAHGGFNRSFVLDLVNQPPRQPDRAPTGLPHFDGMGLPSLEDLFRLDSKWIESVVQQLVELIVEISVEYRQERDFLIQAGKADQIPAVRLDFAQNKLIPAILERLGIRMQEVQLSCEAPMIIFQLGENAPGGTFEYYGRVLENDTAQRQFIAALRQKLRLCMSDATCGNLTAPLELGEGDSFCVQILVALPPPPPRPAKQPIGLGRLSDLIYDTLDPRKEDAPARIRLCSRLKGIDCSRLIPPEFPIGLNFPTWDLLKKYDQEWLLPGASSLEKDSITALQTNPAFIDAFMVGINTQFMSEMRWRDLAVERTCTPLRMFWGQVNFATQQREADILPLAEWAKATGDPIGALSHQSIQPDDPANQSGSRLVIAFRSDLFRRYPSTLVYLVKTPPGATVETLTDPILDPLLKAPPQLDKPQAIPEAGTDQWRKDRVYFGPIFSGVITPELTFFAFDVMSSELDQYWLVLDEPPAELRFRNDKDPTLTNSATFARSTLDQPTRVAISGKVLREQGLDDEHV
jgi:hypothetical protein